MQVTAQADDYTYLAFQTSDSTVSTVSVNNLVITFSGTQLLAVSSDDSKTFTLSDLSQMYFTNTSTSGIKSVSIDKLDGPVKAYSTDGIFMGTFNTSDDAKTKLPKGIYILRQGNKTAKLITK